VDNPGECTLLLEAVLLFYHQTTSPSWQFLPPSCPLPLDFNSFTVHYFCTAFEKECNFKVKTEPDYGG
jgi:hypothetical protein